MTERTPVWAWIPPIFALLWLALPVTALALADPHAWQLALGVAGVLAFSCLFLGIVMLEWDDLAVPLTAMAAIAAVLTLAAQDGFSLLFIYTGSAAGVRLSGRTSVKAVLAIAALAAATLALTDPEGAVFWA